MVVSDLEPMRDTDEEHGDKSIRAEVNDRKDRIGRRTRRGSCDEDFEPDSDDVEYNEVDYGTWAKNECLKVEKGLMTFG